MIAKTAPAASVIPLGQGDLKRLSAFFEAIDCDHYRSAFAPHPFTVSEAERICAHIGRDTYFGVFVGGDGPPAALVGYGMLRGLDAGYAIPSLGLCILEEYQGHGLGKKLLDHLLAASAALGASEVMLKVKHDNPIAQALYRGAGFDFAERDGDHLIGRRLIPPSEQAAKP